MNLPINPSLDSSEGGTICGNLNDNLEADEDLSTKLSVEVALAKVKQSIHELNITFEKLRDLILELAISLDESGKYARDQICRIMKQLLQEEIKSGKITARWIEESVPSEYKRKYNTAAKKSEPNSLSGESEEEALENEQTISLATANSSAASTSEMLLYSNLKSDDDLSKEENKNSHHDQTAQSAERKQQRDIDFQFSLPCEDVNQYLQMIQISARPDQKNLGVWFNGKIDMHTRKVIFAMTGTIADRGDDFDAEERAPRKEPLFGFSVDNGDEVSLAPLHTLVCGLTRESGKTTALEGNLSRWAEKKILVFICKKGEEVFHQYRRVAPFISQGATLSLPKAEFSHELQLTKGIQVMALQNLDSETQAMIIAFVAQEVLDGKIQDWHNVVLVIPEAWQILPRDRDSPAKLPVEAFMRKGAAKGNLVVLDSQDISGISVPIRKLIGNWVMGKQNESNEIKRAIEHLPIKIDWNEMKYSLQTLKLGQFYVLSKGKVTKTFAWPVWMRFYDALDCADNPDTVYKILKKRTAQQA